MKSLTKKIGAVALAGVLTTTAILSTSITQASDDQNNKNNRTPKNVILLIGDGMGSTQVSATSYLKGEGFKAGQLTMDNIENVGLAKTWAHDNTVTDSAAAATAFSAGHKTDNGVLGQAPDQEQEHKDGEKHFDVKTVLESAEETGKSTGLVTTARITHATPAAFASHIDSRDKENEIAEQMLDHDVEVLLGGGKRHFLPAGDEESKRKDDKNMIRAAEEKGYTVVEDKNGLKNAQGDKLLGLFNESHMTWEMDREETKEPALKDMTTKALDQLKGNKDGFFLMVEGGRIDHAGHANFPAANMNETLAFDESVKAALDFAKKDKNTLVVVTADHETGGMSIGANGTYGFNKDVIRNVKRSSEFMASKVNEEKSNIEDVLSKFAGIEDLKEEEIQAIKDAEKTESGIAKVISDRALVGWTTDGHTGVDVPVYTYGPQSDKFTGTIENTKIAKVIESAIKKKDDDD
ncbi:alkaline phosphatase [Pseudalkalibacillus berkeleyi]|uniref:Alkaline phosphatase n=1 Tax=Pseudalkalibacillus berkeleyi TaxID=1069813 RepID=A0ABS9GU00_9BACL|nr:alkaline phosphatase [Pseudalkalibacillus berkeleyi]MCF6136317.1 alkaline phosphatase [Pseudalkalibacillus berkeleyi]